MTVFEKLQEVIQNSPANFEMGVTGSSIFLRSGLFLFQFDDDYLNA